MGVPGRIWRLERARGGKDGLTEAGLGRSPENKIFCLLSGHDGQDRLAMRGIHRFWEGCTGYCVGNLGEFGGETADREDGLGRWRRAQRRGRIWREKGDWGRLGKDSLEEKWANMKMGRSGWFCPYILLRRRRCRHQSLSL